jgi:hypothetical protein
MCDCGEVLKVMDGETMAKAREVNREMQLERMREEQAKSGGEQAVRAVGVFGRILRIFTS